MLYLQVKMVEQQIVKSYKLLSSSSVNFFANDPKLEEMWYIVSCFLFEFFFLCVCARGFGRPHLAVNSAVKLSCFGLICVCQKMNLLKNIVLLLPNP